MDTFDCFEIVFNIKDYLYLFERIFTTEETTVESSSNLDQYVVTNDKFRTMEVNNLNLVCSMMFLRYGCWHTYLELASSQSIVNHTYTSRYIPPCMNRCPYCNNQISNIVKVINRNGLQQFIVDTLINSNK